MQKLWRAWLRRTEPVIVFFIFFSQFNSPLSLAQDTLRPKRNIGVPNSQSKIQFQDTYQQRSQLLLRLLRLPNIVAAPLARNLRFETIDSLARLHPELRNMLLREAIIQGALREDSLDFALRQEFASHLPKWERSDSGYYQEPKTVGTMYNINGVPLLSPGLSVIGLIAVLFKLLGL